MEKDYLESIIKQFKYYKLLGEQAMDQLPAEKLFWQYNDDSNSIAVIVKHLSGNMLSRWAGFLTTDGEKDWRDRDAEFENNIRSREQLLTEWNQGWECLLSTLVTLTGDDLQKIIYIRHQGHTVFEAINRQLAHYPYHIGQIIYISKMISNNWQSLSIPRGNSKSFNDEKFSKLKERQHFTDELLKKDKPSKL